MDLRHVINSLLATLILGGLLVAGCTLSPDDHDPRSTRFEVNVTLADGDKALAADLVDDLPFLSARARVWSLPGDCDDVCDPDCAADATLAGEGDLAVVLGDDPELATLVLAGDLAFTVDSPGSRYRLDVDLLERGRIIEGIYVGDIELESGLGAVVDSLTLSDVIPDDFTIDTLELCLSSDVVEIDPGLRCVDLADQISGTWDADTNAMVMSYIRSGIDVEGVDGDSVLVRLQAALVPAPIYTGCAEVPGLSPGSDTVSIDLILLPTADTGPGLPGEGLRGELSVFLYDDSTEPVLSELGRVTLERRDPLSR
jgi:hypothetical protein